MLISILETKVDRERTITFGITVTPAVLVIIGINVVKIAESIEGVTTLWSLIEVVGAKADSERVPTFGISILLPVVVIAGIKAVRDNDNVGGVEIYGVKTVGANNDTDKSVVGTVTNLLSDTEIVDTKVVRPRESARGVMTNLMTGINALSDNITTFGVTIILLVVVIVEAKEVIDNAIGGGITDNPTIGVNVAVDRLITPGAIICGVEAVGTSVDKLSVAVKGVTVTPPPAAVYSMWSLGALAESSSYDRI